MVRILICFLTALVLPNLSSAAPPDLKPVKEALAKAVPGVPLDTLRPSVVPGFYEVEVNAQLFYVSNDGKYLFLGDVMELATRKNLTETWREQSATKLINAVGESNMIVIGPKQAKRTITVFTDVDCPYCSKLHLEVPELNKQGVKVRYLLFPRSGANSDTYKRSVAVWCAADRVKAVGVAKAGGKIEMKTCSNPVDSHYKLGERLGVNGTPTIFIDDGKKIGGYVPAARLLAILGSSESAKTSQAP